MNPLKRQKGLMIIFILMFFLVSLILILSKPAPIVVGDDMDVSKGGDNQGDQGLIVIQLTGEVMTPGVYALPEGSRVYEAVERAGGLTEEAAMVMVNQARFLKDGEHIHFPSKSSMAESSQGLININTADSNLLMSLPGIGEVKSKSIIQYRETHGAFTDLEDLVLVDGISERLLEGILDRITLY